jgi:hypothetical protein
MLLIAIAFSACRSEKTVYVPIESVRIDSIYTVKVSRDTLMQRDSIYVYEKGDTLRIERWHTRYQSIIKVDTLYINRTDTISVPYPVEKQLSRWQQIKQDTGGAALLLLALCIIAAAVLWLLKKYRR